MIVLGLQVANDNKKRSVRGVILDAHTGSVVAILTHVASPGHDIATQAREARDALASELKPYDISYVVLSEAGYFAKAGLSDAVKHRLRVEGACLTVCRERTDHVVVLSSPALGRALGGSKDAALDAAGELGVEESHLVAAAAALAALRMVGSQPPS